MTTLLVLILACGGGGNPAREAIDKAAADPMDPNGPSGANVPAGKYFCPMHPEIVQDTPGKCPTCNMDLVQKGS
ncbi:MAG: heavy metal-binding domain-containing protein [Myxococcota bacterium]